MVQRMKINIGNTASTLIIIVLCAVFALDGFAATPAVKIAGGPLFGGSGNVHPNMVLSLSVEFPTVGIAYRGDNGTYNRTYEYVGYFNPLKCYAYSGGNRNIVDGYFSISKAADAITHECGGDTFSGNFMNWAASSAIDMLRYALTGGDRIIDTADKTILQRAVLPKSFYANATYFPRRSVTGGGNVSAPNQVTPFNTGTLHIVSCNNRILFSDSKSTDGNCDTSAFDNNGALIKTDKKLGEYLVRVKVCDATEGPVRVDLCAKYGNNYKPVGEMQRHSEKIRFAAMGYLLDDSATRYGGVLRAPMKYVGPKKIETSSFSEAANDTLEWDAATGVFYNNPEDPSDRNNAAVNSGVINYVNKFGHSSIYKGLDPVSELYYEGIRYLQGKQPTPDATTGMTDAMREGFPVLQKWIDPVTASCQKNYMVSIADVNTHWDRYIPGNTRTTYNNGVNANDPVRAADSAVGGKTPAFDVTTWTRKVGEMEADTGGSFTNPAPRPNLALLDKLDTGAGGHGTYYMAGLAYWANTNDIRLDKPTRVKTFAIDVDEGGNGLIDGNTRTLKPRDSQLYLAAKYGGFDDRNKDGNPFITIAADDKTVVKNSNSEWDNNGNGVPANYFLAGQPKELIQSIRKIFSTIASTSGTMSGVSASSTRVAADGAFVYQPGFESSKWSGSLKKLKLTLDEASGEVKIATVADWDAGEILTGIGGKEANPSPDARNVYTAIKDGQTLKTVEFKWDNLAESQKALLNASPADGMDDGLGKQRVDYLRGVRSLELGQENGKFRARDRVLGDIINSNPLYVGPPALNAQGAEFPKFYEDYKGRTKAVYIGANDGMLHGFDAANGKELFAYIPNALIQNLNQLTQQEYVHRPYVDGAMSVAEARVGSKWKTVLASGMGGGAQGVFALDVSNPSNFSGGAGAIWEFTDNDDADMGNLVGAPVIAKFKTKVTGGVAEYKYFVVVPSGLNNYADDGENKFNPAAPGVLFLLSLDKAPSEKWVQDDNYYKFEMPIKDAALQNGLSSPALVTSSDGAVRYAYAGDLQGNLWRLDFAGDAPWPNAKGATPETPLFAATDANGDRQPISTQPKVVFAPGGGFVVLFGTGKFVEDADVASGNFKPQSFYAIYDAPNAGSKVASRSQLAKRTFSANGEVFAVSGNDFTYGLGGSSKRGWYVDFLDSYKTGERLVTNPLVAYGRLFFNTLIPGSDPCASGGGRTYALDVLSGLVAGGGYTGSLSEVGFLSSPTLFETGVVEVGDRNATGKRAVKKKYSIVNFGTEGAKPAPNSEMYPPAGRFSWREILNWIEMRAAANK